MTILLLIIKILFGFSLVNVNCLSLFKTIIDIKIGDDSVLDCPIRRNNWSHPLIFQWHRSINNYTIPLASQFDHYPIHINDVYRNRYSLLTNGSLKIANIQINDNDTFECRLIFIDRGLLDIKEKYSVTLRVNEPPRFVNRSDSIQIAAPYSNVNFLCEIYGVPAATVAWYRVIQQEKQKIDGEDVQLLSVNHQHFTLQNVDDHMAGKYRCVGKNRLGVIQNEFQLLIRGSIYWRQFPRNQTVQVNDSVTLKCEGESSETLQYQWLKDNVSISDTISSQGRIRTYSDGVLNIHNIEPSDHGSYVCIINILNSTNIRSKPALITVKYPPLPSRRRQASNLTLIQGVVGVCPCLLDAYPPIQSVSWYRNGRSIRIQSKSGTYAINSEYALVIRSVTNEDEGEYFCRAQNSEGFGRDSLPIYIEIKEPIQFLSKPDSIYHVHETDRLVLPCVVFGNPQPTIQWFKNSIQLNEKNENLTLKSIDKTDHGLYVCQASNQHTTTNISTLIIVENTTPQAPLNIQYEQVSSNILLSWEPGYDGGEAQHFLIWYRMIQSRKQSWNQIRVIPNNATEFLLFDLKLQQTYEITIVGENVYGLGIFSPIISIYLNNNQDLSIGYLHHHSNETEFLRPLSPTDLYLSQSGSNLYITWNHPNFFESPVNIVYYVIQWRSMIVFNNQQSQQFIVVQHPIRSYILKDIKESKYIIQILSYSDYGTYSLPIEGEIDIQFNSILAYHGSSRVLISILCFLMILTVATLCICAFFILKCYYHRGSYCTDRKSDSKLICGCFPSIQYRLDECSPIEPDRYHTSLLKSIDLQTSPIYTSRHRVTPQTTVQSASPLDSFSDSFVSLAKVTTIPRCRDSIISNPMATPQLTQNSDAVVSFALNDDAKMTSFFQPISIGNTSPISCADVECRKNSSRLPLEAVPELSELHVANSRFSFAQSLSSTVQTPHPPSSVPPSSILITFDSSSLQRRT